VGDSGGPVMVTTPAVAVGLTFVILTWSRVAGPTHRLRSISGVRTRPQWVRDVGSARDGEGFLSGSRLDSSPLADLAPAVVIELVAAALEAGLSIPRAVDVVAGAIGSSSPGGQADQLARAAAALRWGASWSMAWSDADGAIATVADALEPAWLHGSAPGEALRAAAAQAHRERRAAARVAAGRLGVLVVLPLGLCLLPAFMLLGLVPVIISMAGGVV